ncbi:MAG: cytochrome C [Chlorobiaceae bacterium]|nr:cytochrome C [Chlorobiaceae bacterium]
MKPCCLKLLAVLAGLLFYGNMIAEEAPSVEKGRQLFNSTEFAGAVSGKSCSSCHPGGSGLQFAWQNPYLAAQVNNCILGPLRGKPLDEESSGMQSMLLYIRSLKK